MRLALVVVLGLSGCVESPAPASCSPAPWIAEGEPLAIPVRATGAAVYDASDPEGTPLVPSRTSGVREGAATTLVIETATGDVELEVGLARARLGVLPLGEIVRVTFDHGFVLLDDTGRIRTAVVSRRGSGEAVASTITFRQSYAECATSTSVDGCWRAMASPLVDVVTGPSVIRVAPGGSFRVPNDEAPTAEIEIVRSVRAPDESDAIELPSPLCADAPVQEIAAIIRHLR